VFVKVEEMTPTEADVLLAERLLERRSRAGSVLSDEQAQAGRRRSKTSFVKLVKSSDWSFKKIFFLTCYLDPEPHGSAFIFKPGSGSGSAFA
jgi:hypothetical protein